MWLDVLYGLLASYMIYIQTFCVCVRVRFTQYSCTGLHVSCDIGECCKYEPIAMSG